MARWGRAVGLAVVATGLASAPGGAASAAEATLERVEAAVPRIEEMARALVTDGTVPGLAIGIVFEDRVVYVGGFGVREAGKPETVDADTVFQLASFSKPIAATIVAALVGEGVLEWDSRIADLDPMFALHDAYPDQQVTVTDLFAHRSGLPGGAGNELEAVGFDRTEILHRLRFVSPESSFRSAYSYSNFGITAGAVAAAAGAGLAWEEAAEEKLYAPLGMTSTSSRHEAFLARQNRAALHIPEGNGWAAKVTREPDAQSPAGGVASNVRDLVKWLALEINAGQFEGRQVIDADALAATHEPIIHSGQSPITGAPAFYGRGWTIDFGRHGMNWGHAGAFSAGARTLVSILPDEKLGIVVLSNAFPTGAPEAIAETFFELVLVGEPSQDWLATWNGIYDDFMESVTAMSARFATPPEAPSAALPLAAYVGDYANRYAGTAKVTEAGGSLVLALGPDGTKSYPLRHFDRDTFVYAPAIELPDLMTSAVFTIGPDQKAATLVLEDFGAGDAVLPRAGE